MKGRVPWAEVFDRLFAARPAMSFADAGGLTPHQTTHLLRADEAEPEPREALAVLLDDVAQQLRLSPSGLAGWPVAEVARVASRLAGGPVPQWSLQFSIVQWREDWKREVAAKDDRPAPRVSAQAGPL